MRHAFVVSPGRTATRALAAALGRVPGLTPAHDALDLSAAAWRWRQGILERDLLEALAYQQVAELAPERGAWVDVDGAAGPLLAVLDAALDGEAAWVHVRRDAHDCVASLYYRDPTLLRLPDLAWRGSPRQRQALRRAAILYHTRTRLVEAQLAGVEADRQLTVRFADLTAGEHAPAWHKLLGWLGERLAVDVHDPPALTHDANTPRTEPKPHLWEHADAAELVRKVLQGEDTDYDELVAAI